MGSPPTGSAGFAAITVAVRFDLLGSLKQPDIAVGAAVEHL